MCIWQYVLDFIAFYNYINLPNTEPEIVERPRFCWSCDTEIWPKYGMGDFQRYECFGYILTNSSNMKRFMVFIAYYVKASWI